MPSPIPRIKMAAKIAMDKALNIEGIEAEDLSLGGAENVSLGLEDLDLRFIFAYVNFTRIGRK